MPDDKEATEAASGRTEPAPIALTADRFRALGHALVDDIAQFLESLPGKRVAPGESPHAVRSALGTQDPLPAGGADAGEILESIGALLFEHSLFNGHPRFFGYITSSP